MKTKLNYRDSKGHWHEGIDGESKRQALKKIRAVEKENGVKIQKKKSKGQSQKPSVSVEKEKTWAEKYNAGQGLTLKECTEGNIVKIGNRIGTIDHMSGSSVTIVFKGSGSLNVAPDAQVDEVLGKDKQWQANASVDESATRLDEGDIMSAKNITKNIKKNAKAEKSLKSVVKKTASNGKTDHVEATAPKEGTLARFIFDSLSKGLTDEAIGKGVKKEFLKSNFKTTTLNGYRKDLHKKYGLVLGKVDTKATVKKIDAKKETVKKETVKKGGKKTKKSAIPF